MNYCLRHKNGDFVNCVSVNFKKSLTDNIVDFSLTPINSPYHYFISIEAIHALIVNPIIASFSTDDKTLNNYKKLVKKLNYLNHYEIWQQTYRNSTDLTKICNLDLDRCLFTELFKYEYKNIMYGLHNISRKLLDKYDLLIGIDIKHDTFVNLINNLSLNDIDYRMLKMNYLDTFFLFNQEDINYIKLTFENDIDFTYSYNSKQLSKQYKIYKKYLGEIKKIENTLQKHKLCKTRTDSTYNQGMTRQNF